MDLTEKEMLKNLKYRFDEVAEYYRVSEKELEWLIQQAEKVEQLEKEAEWYREQKELRGE